MDKKQILNRLENLSNYKEVKEGFPSRAACLEWVNKALPLLKFNRQYHQQSFQDSQLLTMELSSYTLNPALLRIKSCVQMAVEELRMEIDSDDNKDIRKILISEIETQRNLMISVSTGGARIQEVNDAYMERYAKIREMLNSLNLDDPNSYQDLWAWHGKWSSGDLPTYKSRRQYIGELYNPLVERLRQVHKVDISGPLREPTGWTKVDRQADKAKAALESAKNEEDFQSVGLLCRELLISLAQAVYDPERHGSLDVEKISGTDAKRMLEAFVVGEVPGKSNDEIRKYAKAGVNLAVHLQHKRTASIRDALLCMEASISVVNSIAILSGRRDS